MGKFLSDMFLLGIEGVSAYATAKKKVGRAGTILERLVSGNEEVSSDEFIEMYNMRIHNFDSKRDDIKFMKKHDFEGVYVLYNCSRNKYYVGKSGRVLRKIDRQFRGYEDENIYNEYQKGDKFTVRIVSFQNSGYDSIDALEKNLKKQYELQ